jgi:mannosyl-oligosaccharide glucosidase
MDGSKSGETQLRFLRKVYPKFKRQYEWFHETQMGQLDEWDYKNQRIKLGFKWRGRKGSHILTSGMDDYPRSVEAHPGDLHVDLLCWVYYFSKSLEKVGDILGLDSDVNVFKEQQGQMLETLESLAFN